MNKPTRPPDYAELLEEIKDRIGQAQTRAILTVNAELIRLYWDIGQLIDNIPGGPVDAFTDSKMVKPPKREVYGSIEGLIQHFELIMTNRGWKAPIAEAYGHNEGPNGEQGFFIVSDGSARPWRVTFRF